MGKLPWRRRWQHTPVFLPGESHGRGVWQATAHRVTKESEWLDNNSSNFGGTVFYWNTVDLQYCITVVQQSGSVMYIHTHIHIFFFIVVYHKILSIVPSATQQDLVHPFCVWKRVPANPSLPSVPPPAHSPLAAACLFCVSVNLFHRWVQMG